MQKQNPTIKIARNIHVIFLKKKSNQIIIRCLIDANLKSPVGANIFIAEIYNGKWRCSDRATGQRIYNHLWKYRRNELANCVQQLQSVRAAY